MQSSKAQEIKDLEYLVKGHKGMQSYAAQVRDDDAYYERERDRLQGHIDKLTEQLDRLNNTREDADNIIAQSQVRIHELRRKINAMKANPAIAKILKLQKKMEELL